MLASAWILGETLTAVNMGGLVICLLGIGWYNRSRVLELRRHSGSEGATATAEPAMPVTAVTGPLATAPIAVPAVAPPQHPAATVSRTSRQLGQAMTYSVNSSTRSFVQLAQEGP